MHVRLHCSYYVGDYDQGDGLQQSAQMKMSSVGFDYIARDPGWIDLCELEPLRTLRCPNTTIISCDFIKIE